MSSLKFYRSDQEHQGGISPHISPFMNIANAGNLLSATGFNMHCGYGLYPGGLSERLCTDGASAWHG
ncbi:unnamed protein product [Peronospora destructor]|uniref:Uncharacterized protein n=1 Tax=Peronospora destructor TaxID=86335 RepID=A0AAV0VB77_9STRA|nr:unnamed protein product [Peronospora destructor]